MIDFKLYENSMQMLREGRFDDLKSMLKQHLDTITDDAEGVKTLEQIMTTVQTPVIKSNVKTWCDNKNLPDKMVSYLTDKIGKLSLSLEEKIELSERLANDKPLLKFSAMVKAAGGKAVNVESFFTEPKLGKAVLEATKNENDKQLLGAPTNIGKGEVAFIILGSLMKPKQGDLQDGSNVIELKEPSAFIGPKGSSHPSKSLKDMRTFISKLTKAPLPKDDRFAGRGGSADTALSYLLALKSNGKKSAFPLGEWAKANRVSINDVKKIVNKMHDLSYPMKFDAGKYVKSDFSFDFDKYGQDAFAAMFLEYQKGSAFETLMVYQVDTGKVICIKNEADAKALFKKVGNVNFNGNDAHGLDGALGPKINYSKFKKML